MGQILRQEAVHQDEETAHKKYNANICSHLCWNSVKAVLEFIALVQRHHRTKLEEMAIKILAQVKTSVLGGEIFYM